MSIFKSNGPRIVTQEEIALTQQAAAYRQVGRDYEAGEAESRIRVLASQRAPRDFETNSGAAAGYWDSGIDGDWID